MLDIRPVAVEIFQVVRRDADSARDRPLVRGRREHPECGDAVPMDVVLHGVFARSRAASCPWGAGTLKLQRLTQRTRRDATRDNGTFGQSALVVRFGRRARRRRVGEQRAGIRDSARSDSRPRRASVRDDLPHRIGSQQPAAPPVAFALAWGRMSIVAPPLLPEGALDVLLGAAVSSINPPQGRANDRRWYSSSSG
jgi:hypothetical protein